MNERMRFSVRALMALGLVLSVVVLFSGCREEQPMASHDHAGHDHGGHDHATMEESAAEQTPTEAGDPVVASTEQTTCPVMEGNLINKDIFVEYKGKKVYFCCEGCDDAFLADPEKYVSKLPQFSD